MALGEGWRSPLGLNRSRGKSVLRSVRADLNNRAGSSGFIFAAALRGLFLLLTFRRFDGSVYSVRLLETLFVCANPPAL
jgi:hypothetical protein